MHETKQIGWVIEYAAKEGSKALPAYLKVRHWARKEADLHPSHYEATCFQCKEEAAFWLGLFPGRDDREPGKLRPLFQESSLRVGNDPPEELVKGRGPLV